VFGLDRYGLQYQRGTQQRYCHKELADGLPAEAVRKYTGLGKKEIFAIQ
jgi:hypothetical protein